MKNNLKDDSDRRSLHRLPTSGRNELSAILKNESYNIYCEIVDFNSEGLGLKVEAEIIRTIKEDPNSYSLEIIYGNRKIANAPAFEFTQISESGRIGIKFGSSKRHSDRKTSRLSISKRFKPLIIANDPLRIGESIHLNVLNLNGSGLLLSTSLSNKHLVPGIIINQARLVLPGINIISLNLEIRHAKREADDLLIGVAFYRPATSDLEALTQFSLFGVEPPERIGHQSDIDTTNLITSKRLGSALRVSFISTPEEYGEMLRTRFEAYKHANKISKTDSVEQMADEYDERSVIIIGRVAGRIGGTARLVNSILENEKFPFERYIRFEKAFPGEHRKDYFEVSRLSILPEWQGTDLLLRLFQEMSKQTVLNKKGAICLATQHVQRNYKLLGWQETDHIFPHPVLKGETLTIMKIMGNDFIAGKRMAATSWFKIGKAVATHLADFNVVDVPKTSARLIVMRTLEKLILQFRNKTTSGYQSTRRQKQKKSA